MLSPSLSVIAGVENSGPRHAEHILRLGFSLNISYLCSIAILCLRSTLLYFHFPFMLLLSPCDF